MAKKNNTEKINFRELIQNTKIPLLSLDPRWHNLFPEHEKPSEIKHLENDLNNALKRQGALNHENKQLKTIKKNLMSEIVANMDATFDSANKDQVKLLEQNQRLILEVNQKSIENEKELEEIPHVIASINERLMLRSLEICYKRLAANTEMIQKLDEWIIGARLKLRDNMLIKQDREIRNNEIYSTMHDILGPNVIDFFDSKIGGMTKTITSLTTEEAASDEHKHNK